MALLKMLTNSQPWRVENEFSMDVVDVVALVINEVL